MKKSNKGQNICDVCHEPTDKKKSDFFGAIICNKCYGILEKIYKEEVSNE